MFHNKKVLISLLLGSFAFSAGLGTTNSGSLARAAEPAAPESQPAQKPAEPADQKSYALPTITVTADKRATEMQKTPMAITVITEQEIQDAGIKTVQDVLRHVPNVTSFTTLGGESRMSFRGAVTADGTRTSPLILYVDGVPVDTYFNFDANLMDIERVEVLRGPQSAIYGKNALGGVINIISKKPNNTYAGKVTTYVESEGSYGTGATVSGPLKEDKLFFSLSARHDYDNGYMKNDDDRRNYERTERVKGLLRLTPTDRAEINLHMDYTAGRDGFYPFTSGQGAPMRNDASNSDYQHDNTFNTALHGKFDTDTLTFESISTYRKENLDYQIDYFSIMPPIEEAQKGTRRSEATQEFRLRSPDGASGLTWLLGVYGSYSDMDTHKFAANMNMVIPMPPPFPPMSIPYTYANPSREFTKEIAPFGQISVPITEALKLTAGLRWDYTERDFSLSYNDNFGSDVHTRLSDSWDELLPKVTLSYQITDNHMVYAGVGRSFIPGGYNWSSTTGENLTYDSETAWNYETGIKTAWLDNRLNVDLTLFYNDFKDMQVMTWVGPGVSDYAADNAGAASSYGAELEINARLTQGLTADVNLGYTHAEYDNYKTMDPVLGEISFDGNRVQFTPKFTASAGLTYRHENGFFVRGDMNYYSNMYWDYENTTKRPAVTTVDARIGYEGETIEAYAYGRNIFGERYQTHYMPLSKVGMVAEPQIFGIELSYKF